MAATSPLRVRGDDACRRTPHIARLLLAMLIAIIANHACASSSLSFEGGGYWIDMEIGDDGSAPAIARVIFHPGDDASGVQLQATRWRIEVFDPERQQLRLRHLGTDAVAPFVLDADRARAVLQLDRRRIEAAFDWGM